MLHDDQQSTFQHMFPSIEKGTNVQSTGVKMHASKKPAQSDPLNI